MRVRIKRPFGAYREGEVFDFADGVANVYIERGYVEPVEHDADPAEKGMDAPAANKAILKPKRKKRKKVTVGE